MTETVEIIKAAIFAELARQCEEAGLYQYNTDATSTGVDGILYVDALAKAITDALAPS